MYDEGALAYTGAGITIFGTSVGLGWVVGVGVTLIVVGALAYRYAKRRARRNAS